MELNKIQLPAFVVSDLYKKSLVELDNGQQKTVPPEKNQLIRYLGNNRKNITICVDYKDAKYLPDVPLSFLTSMLTACNLGLDDVAVVNMYGSNSTYKEISSELKSKIIFLFGIEPPQFGLPLNFPEFQVQEYNKTSFLYCPSLDEIAIDKILKSKLWVCLRRIFSI